MCFFIIRVKWPLKTHLKSLSHVLLGASTRKHTHNTYTQLPPVFTQRASPADRQVSIDWSSQRPESRRAAPRLLYREIDSRTITRANDVSAEQARQLRAALWRWRKRRAAREVEKMECFHSYLIGHVPPPRSPLYWIKVHHPRSLLFLARHFKGCPYSPHTI